MNVRDFVPERDRPVELSPYFELGALRQAVDFALDGMPCLGGAPGGLKSLRAARERIRWYQRARAVSDVVLAAARAEARRAEIRR